MGQKHRPLAGQAVSNNLRLATTSENVLLYTEMITSGRPGYIETATACKTTLSLAGAKATCLLQARLTLTKLIIFEQIQHSQMLGGPDTSAYISIISCNLLRVAKYTTRTARQNDVHHKLTC